MVVVELSLLASLSAVRRSALLDVGIGESIGDIMTKRTKSDGIKIDWAGTKRIRSAMAKQKFVKITINLDAESLAALKAESEKTGVPYQRLLNSLLRENLSQRRKAEARLERLEKELELVKRKLAA